ncbi:hybrid sensor histidine kinase/response regulator [Loktanella sp. S4079]|uniref:hybrid sensor histidine kinase/response regulator n=1 Tax=Loktanella sp. S4079 TaxID=579483 RepID=UPI00138E1431|nr:ATP-binding protein [Loktanella sp. S4079]
MLTFQDSLDRFNNPVAPTTVTDVRRRFDVLYSRYNALSSGRTFEIIRVNPTTLAALQQIETFLVTHTPTIDGPDTELSARTLIMANELRDLRADARQIAIDGITSFAEEADEHREHASSLLYQISVLAISLIVFLIASLSVLFRQFESAQEESHQHKLTNVRLQAIVGASLDAIIVTDEAGTVLDYNDAAVGIFGYARKEAIGATLSDLISPASSHEERSADFARLFSDEGTGFVGSGLSKIVAQHKDGHEFPIEVSVASSAGADGMIFVSFLRDISQRETAKRELTTARDEALAADKAKTEFLAVMSHEMRTPLNGIMATLDLLSASDIKPKQRNYVEVAQKSSKFLLRHINDVLDISKFEAGKLTLKSNRFSPVALLQEMAEGSQLLAASQGNDVSVNCDFAPGQKIIGDQFRISQILMNLAGNALKFTSNGDIEFSLSTLKGAHDSEMIEFRVTDNGIGIPDDQLNTIFDDFVALDTSYSRRADGTGLGLGICKRLVKAMGGEIGVESIVGEGSSFWFTVPLQMIEGETSHTETATPKPTPSLDRGKADHRSILLVEDNQINRFVAREMLENLGHRVVEAHDGKEGVMLANQHAFDLILMDISMPVMDGVTAAREILESDGKSSDAYIVALTAHTQPSERARFREAGMSDYLTKPVRMETLRSTLERALVPITEAAKTHEPPAPAGDLIDHSVLNDMLDLFGPARFDEHLVKLENEFDEAFRQIESGIPLDQIEPLAHRLMGSLGTFGATKIVSILGRVEQACQSIDSPSVEQNLKRAKDCWIETRQQLLEMTKLVDPV